MGEQKQPHTLTSRAMPQEQLAESRAEPREARRSLAHTGTTNPPLDPQIPAQSNWQSTAPVEPQA